MRSGDPPQKKHLPLREKTKSFVFSPLFINCSGITFTRSYILPYMKSPGIIQHMIHEVRGQKVMPGFDLTEWYDVETRALNKGSIAEYQDKGKAWQT